MNVLYHTYGFLNVTPSCSTDRRGPAKTLRRPSRHTMGCKRRRTIPKVGFILFVILSTVCFVQRKAEQGVQFLLSTMPPMLSFTGRPIKSHVMGQLLS